MHAIKALIYKGVAMKKSSLMGLVATFCAIAGCTVTTGNGANAQQMSGSDFLSKLGRTLEGDRNAFARKPGSPSENTPEVVPQAAATANVSAPVKATVTAPIVEVSSAWSGGGVETGTASTWGTMHVGGFNLYCDEVRVQSNLDVDVAYSRVMRNFRLTSQAQHANRLEQNVVSNWVMRHFQHTAQPGIYYKLGDEVRVSLDGAQYVPKQKSPYFYLTQFELAKDAPRNLFMGRYCLALSYETGDALKASSIAKAKSVVTALFN